MPPESGLNSDWHAVSKAHIFTHRGPALSGTRAFINIFILIQFYFSTLYFIHNKSTVDRVFAFWSSIRPLPLASQSVLPTSSGLILAHGRIFRVVISWMQSTKLSIWNRFFYFEMCLWNISNNFTIVIFLQSNIGHIVVEVSPLKNRLF